MVGMDDSTHMVCHDYSRNNVQERTTYYGKTNKETVYQLWDY